MENAEGDAGWEGVAAIFKLYDSLGPDTTITGVKLISQTLVELFKDLAPGFEIKQTAQAGDRLKKTTRQVYGLEGKLLKSVSAIRTHPNSSQPPLTHLNPFQSTVTVLI